MKQKNEVRRQLIEKRLDISPHRRNVARKDALNTLLPRLKSFTNILSFASKEEEIDLWPLNAELAKEKRLILTRIASKEELILFRVCDLEKDLQDSGRWNIKEPLMSRCEPMLHAHIDCVLVPGLGFDSRYNRIGYGLGHYDRLLPKLSCPTFGIGFKEQHFEGLLPIEPHDVPLSEILLF